MDVKALEKTMADTVKVRLAGQTFTLKAPTMKRAAAIQHAAGRRLADAGEPTANNAHVMMEVCLDLVEELLVEKVPRPLLEKVVTRSGMIRSPLVHQARVLCGDVVDGEEEDPDRDLPTSLPAA